MNNKNILMVGLQDWDTDIGSNAKNIALELAKTNRVLYVNYPLDRNTRKREAEKETVKKRLAAIASPMRAPSMVAPNLWSFYPGIMLESINWIKNPGLFDLFNRRNNKLFANEIRKAAKYVGFESFILFNDNDIFRSLYLPEMLQPEFSIYYLRDYLVGVDYWRYHATRLEPRLMATYDMVAANSQYLADYAKKYNAHSYFVGQGCDFSNTEPDYVPVLSELSEIPRPIAGYVGSLASHRLDVKLMEDIAKQNSQLSFVLIGPEDEIFAASGLHSLPNVYFLGKREPASLQAYINCFDVCINPQLVNEVTIGNYPRKVDEYLSCGKPVVATRTDAMDYFNGYVYLAESAESFSESLYRALIEDNLEKQKSRAALALEHTWYASVESIKQAYNKVKGDDSWQKSA